MKFDMIISDYDWTLGDKKIIEKDTLDAIKKYEEKGGKFVICTGRPYLAITEICQIYNLQGVIVYSQGAGIIDLKANKKLLDGGLDSALATEIILDMQSDGVKPVVDIDDVIYSEGECNYTIYHKEYYTATFVDNLAEFVKNTKGVIHKVVTADDEKIIASLGKKYRERYKGRALFNSGSDRLIEAVHPDYSKGATVRFLSKYFDIPLNKIMTVGDSNNDIELLDGEWHGVAVGSAKEELKKVAKEITLPFGEQPIKHLIEKYCL